MDNSFTYRSCGCSSPCDPPCNCVDNFLTQSTFCGTTPDCYNPEKCSETFATDCIVYTGDSIKDLGIIKGARMTDVIQIILNALVNPGCTFPTAPCLSVVGFGSSVITQSTATFVWTPIIGVTNYQVQYQAVGTTTWVLNPITTNTFDTIGGLTPNTQYYVKVITTCGTNSCSSLTLLITTNTN